MASDARALDRLVGGLLGRIRPQQGRPVPAATLLGWYARRGAGPALRGALRAPLLGSASLPLFIGRGTVIEYGSQLHLGRSVQLGAGVRITAFSKSGVRLGDRVTVREGGWIQCTSHPSTPGEGLEVGDRTYIGPRATIGAGGMIRIGRDCQLGANVTLIAENHTVTEAGASAHDVVRRGIVIGDRCWLGHGATVLDGVRIGDGAVVGAGAVVTKDVAAGTTVAGVPGRPIQHRS